MKLDIDPFSGCAHSPGEHAFDHILTTFFCPHCGTKTVITIGWIKARNSFACHACGHYILLGERILPDIARLPAQGLDGASKNRGGSRHGSAPDDHRRNRRDEDR